MVVRARGGTCEVCAPGADTHSWTSAPAEASVRVWWAGSSSGDAHWQAVREATDHRGRQPTKTRTIDQDQPTDSPAQADVNWAAALAPAAQRVLGDDLLVVARAWQPIHCRILDGLAGLLEAFWNEIVAEDGGPARLVIRLSGLPPLVAASVPELAFRALRAGRHGAASIVELVALIRSAGPVFCALTGHATGCSEMRYRLGVIPELPTPEALEKLGARPVLMALTGISGLPTLTDLLGEPAVVAPEAVREHRHEPVPEATPEPVPEAAPEPLSEATGEAVPGATPRSVSAAAAGGSAAGGSAAGGSAASGSASGSVAGGTVAGGSSGGAFSLIGTQAAVGGAGEASSPAITFGHA